MPSKRCITGSFKNQLTNSAPEHWPTHYCKNYHHTGYTKSFL